MALGDLNPASWRIDVYEVKSDTKFGGYITDLSNFYTSDLTITRQRNYPDEVKFTLDLKQLDERATALGISSRDILDPYEHKVKIYRNNEFVMQAIVIKVDVNLTNEGKNTVDVSCVDVLGLFEKRLIHQDYGQGSWADFAKEVVMDAQHEPNRIYNYSFEGDGTTIDNVWFRGWKYTPGEDTLKNFPEWIPNHLYSMYDNCTYGGKFWEAKEHAFTSGEEFSESNWTLLGVLDAETNDVTGVYGIWREDESEPGPTETYLGGWGGSSSCHVSAETFTVNNGNVTTISMANAFVSTSLVAPIDKDAGAPILPDAYEQLEYIQQDYGKTSMTEVGAAIDTGVNAKEYEGKLKISVDAQMLSGVSTDWHTLIGVANGGSDSSWAWNPQYQLAWNGDGVLVCETPNEVDVTLESSYKMNTNRHTYTLDTTGDTARVVSVDNAVVVQDTQVMTTNPNTNLYLASRNFVSPNSTYAKGCYCGAAKYYGCKIWAINDRLLRDFIPCKRVSDGAVGMYDLVYGKFYTTATSKKFSAGGATPYQRTSDTKIHTRVMLRNAEGSLNMVNYTLGEKTILTSFDMNIATVYLSGVAAKYVTAAVNGLTAEYVAHSKNLRLYYQLKDGTRVIVWSGTLTREAVTAATVAGVGDPIQTLYDNPPENNLSDNIIIQSTYDYKKSKVKLYLEGLGGENRLFSDTITVTDSGWQAVEQDFALPGFDVYRFGFIVTYGDVLADTPLCYIKPVEGDVWDLGVRVGDFPTVTEQREEGWLRNRTTSTYEWKNAKETLLDLSNMDSDNFWYSVDENYKFNVHINEGSDTVNVALSYPKNITSMTVSTDAGNVYNYIKGDGSADVSQDPLVSGVENSNGAPFTWIEYNEESMKKYWALAEAVNFDSETGIEALQNDISSELATVANMQNVPTVKIANNAVTPDQVALGDIVSIEAIDVPYVKNVNGLYKITSYTIGVDTNGNESLDLTLISPTDNQINALSFPQLIKMMLNRLRGVR